METILLIHGSLRWIVAVLLIATLIGGIIVFLRKSTIPILRWIVLSGVIVTSLQLVLGGILLIYDSIQANWDMKALRYQYEHAFGMVIALGVVHLLPRAFRAPTVQQQSIRLIGLAIVAIALVGWSVIRLRGLSYWLPFIAG
ncbi:MAG: hypothetical protein RML15_03410 [Bacteroidota bacterium]|nr:hypothetical protein [Candidatus Kapabacteria bacterium]MCS7301932.1 hypothetical protein [Candidatus Kapabacteria bacterium]MDW8074805.1 hypothetical protein [Bacteroidota bacterium]MDW8271444.1 hypothetical protein [Bacteroidota bacterium]